MTTGNGEEDKCYFCKGTGLLESDEDCPCVSNACRCYACLEGREGIPY